MFEVEPQSLEGLFLILANSVPKEQAFLVPVQKVGAQKDPTSGQALIANSYSFSPEPGEKVGTCEGLD